MYLKLIACSIFQRELCALLATTPHTVDVTFIELGEHGVPSRLRELVQSAIDAPCAPRARELGLNYDAILLAYGICGNTATGLCAREIPLVIPRAHDCATILLGSRDAFITHFGDNPCQSFGCVGYHERGYNNCLGDHSDRPISDPEYEKYLAEYGEENARYLWETLHPRVSDGRALFITTPPTRDHPSEAEFRATAQREKLTYVELTGSTRLLDALVNGPWNPDDFLIIPPGQKIHTIYDQVRVMDARLMEGGCPQPP